MAALRAGTQRRWPWGWGGVGTSAAGGLGWPPEAGDGALGRTREGAHGTRVRLAPHRIHCAGLSVAARGATPVAYRYAVGGDVSNQSPGPPWPRCFPASLLSRSRVLPTLAALTPCVRGPRGNGGVELLERLINLRGRTEVQEGGGPPGHDHTQPQEGGGTCGAEVVRDSVVRLLLERLVNLRGSTVARYE